MLSGRLPRGIRDGFLSAGSRSILQYSSTEINTEACAAAGLFRIQSAMHAERCSLLIVKQQPEEASAFHADILG